MVHCTAAGPEPPVLATEIFTLNALPGTVLPEPMDTATCCAIAWLVAVTRNIQTNLENILLDDFEDEDESIMKSSGRLLMNTYGFSCFPVAGTNLISRRAHANAHTAVLGFALSRLDRHVLFQSADRGLRQRTQQRNKECDVVSENFTSMPTEDLPTSESYTAREQFAVG
jgi:hypothetical protein